jgi:elongation factor 1-alpha
VPWFKRKDPNAIAPEYQPQLSTSVIQPDTAAAAPPDIIPTSGTAIRVQDVYTISGIGTVIVGYVEAGVVHPPMRFHVVAGKGSPTGSLSVDVVQIEMHHHEQPEARVGDFAGFTLKGLPPGVRSRDLVRRGDVLIAAEPDP